MSIEVQMGKQVLNVAAEFRNSQGQVVAAPENTGSNYEWSLGKTEDEAVVSIEQTPTGVKLTPTKLGTDTLTLRVTLDSEGLQVLTGTLSFTVAADPSAPEGDQTPATITLNGTVESA